MLTIGVVLWIGFGLVKTSAADTTYFDKKIQQIMAFHLLSEESFYLFVVPITDRYIIASQYKQWVAQGYREEEMVNLSKEAVSRVEGKLYVFLRAGLAGGVVSTGRQAVVLPENLKDSVLVVTDRGDTLRCEAAEVPFARAVTLLNPEVEAALIFPTTLKKGGRERDVLREATSIEFVIKGLGFKRDRIRYALPLSQLFEDAPEVIKRLFRQASKG
jgi:hypothetical protein